jgi:hypothetical protein
LQEINTTMEQHQESVTITLKHYNELRMLSEAHTKPVAMDFMGNYWYGLPDYTADVITSGAERVKEAQRDYRDLYDRVKSFNDLPWWKRIFRKA